MNFRTESFDLPQNEHLRCLSCDISQDSAGSAHPASRAGVGRRELTLAANRVKQRTTRARECFHEPGSGSGDKSIDHLPAVAAWAAITCGSTISPRLVITLSIRP